MARWQTRRARVGSSAVVLFRLRSVWRWLARRSLAFIVTSLLLPGGCDGTLQDDTTAQAIVQQPSRPNRSPSIAHNLRTARTPRDFPRRCTNSLRDAIASLRCGDDGDEPTTYVVTIAVTPTNPHLPLGTSQQLTATGVFSDGTTRDITADVQWRSDATTLAASPTSLDAYGRVTADNLGTADAYAMLDGVMGHTQITVVAATQSRLAVTPASVLLVTGRTQQLTASATYSDGTTRDVTSRAQWLSTDKSVATISASGQLIGRAPGTATVRATFDGMNASATLSVRAALMTITVTPADPAVAAGQTQPLIATGSYSDRTTQVLTEHVRWTVDNPNVASISNQPGERGMLRGLADGTTQVSASLDGRTGSTRITVHVVASVCGNGIREARERCDDGNTRAGDGCRADCMGFETCGDGQLDPLAGEQCDDGNTAEGDDCSAACRLAPFASRAPRDISGTATCTLAGAVTGRKAAVDQAGNFYVLMDCAGTAAVAASRDRGATWSEPLTTGIDRAREMAIEGGPAGVASVAAVTAAGDLVFSQTLDAGRSWTEPLRLDSGIDPRQVAMDSLGSALYISVLAAGNPRIYANFAGGQGQGQEMFSVTDIEQASVFLDLIVDHVSGQVISVSDAPELHLRISRDQATTFASEVLPPGFAFRSDWAGSNGFLYLVGMEMRSILVISLDDPTTSRGARGLAAATTRVIDADALGNAYVVSELSSGGIQLDRLVAGSSAVLAADRAVLSASQGTVPMVAALPSNSGALVAFNEGGKVYSAVVVYP